MAAKRLAALPAGAVLEVWTTDPMAVVDIPHMCHQEGHSLQDSRAGEGHHIFVIAKV
jgi:tRNA 2-thiouridine synthesizing protein A